MSEGATNAPVPSKLVFLYELASLPPATKVRFVGCVLQYDVLNGQLLLEHAYPKNAHPVPRVSVDVSLVLESTASSALRHGCWINVIGYTQNSGVHARKRKDSLHRRDEVVSLQAILIWDAGSLRIRDYENTLEEQRLVQQQLQAHPK
ncbi:uncharacterized protein Z518_02279 [Rhinocladiella mackenziei CBS 650.93]|uniref:CST complex subunit Ten1 n=1 Tax=Rhinocladiella mackenziei CBS 650.93 TaxID=1442369 RepID=A0A0D2IWE3_9EURO|nr:uncharacterized protein Z518_02279 [Rhinocladiella mackenziei CBS 650.93]KIX07626.1 hypothetical protein Z518_02279 [Rhinocladiella mackenziei CBS 650.93]